MLMLNMRFLVFMYKTLEFQMGHRIFNKRLFILLQMSSSVTMTLLTTLPMHMKLSKMFLTARNLSRSSRELY